jgi:hypothetical protein
MTINSKPQDTMPQLDHEGVSPVSNSGEGDHTPTTSLHDEKRSIGGTDSSLIYGEEYRQSRGVTRMENVAYFAKNGGRIGKTTYYLIGISVLVCMFVVSCSTTTRSDSAWWNPC